MREIEKRIVDGDEVFIVVTPKRRDELVYCFECKWYTVDDRGLGKTHTIMLENLASENIGTRVQEQRAAAKDEAEQRYLKCKTAKSL